MGVGKIAFELTNRCNLICGHCLRDRSLNSDLEIELIEKVLKEIKPYGINRVAFTGGEPLVHPQFKEIIELCAREGFLISFVTNGIELNKFWEFLLTPEIKDKVTNVAVSLEGPDEETNDAVRGKGSFKKTLKGIVGLRARKIPFAIKFSINRLNYKKLEEMVLFAAKLEAVEIDLTQIYPSPENLAKGLMLEPKDWQELHSEIARLSKLVRIPVIECVTGYSEYKFPLCTNLMMADYYVDARGWLGLCCLLPGTAGRPKGEERERVADLKTTSFVQAHRKLLDLIQEMRLIWLERIEKDQNSELDHYMCVNCGFYLGKLEWLKRVKNSAWANLLNSAKEKSQG